MSIEKYNELAKKIHDERSKPNNECDHEKVAKYEEELSILEKEMGIKKID